MDFKRPARSQPERTGREDRRLKFYGLRDNLERKALVIEVWTPEQGVRTMKRS
jgi:hypothetical protein